MVRRAKGRVVLAAGLATIVTVVVPVSARGQQAPAPPEAPGAESFATAAAQQPLPVNPLSDGLDPSSPLAPLPGLDVDWPDLAIAPGAPAAANAARPAAARADTRYQVRVEGLADVDEARVSARFNALSALRQHEGEPANAAQLDRRAREDGDLLTVLLRAAGYYDARVSGSVDASIGMPVVTLAAEPGPLYRLSAVTLGDLASSSGDKAAGLRKAFGVQPADAANADVIAEGQAALIARLGEEGFPFAKVGEPALLVDHATQQATLQLPVETGGARSFGKITLVPNRLFGGRHVADIARFRPGDPYNASQLDDLRRALIQTGIVASAAVDPVEGTAPGTVDIAVAVQPAPLRTIAGAFGYGTGEGVRAEVSWTHRNLFPPEGGLTLRGVAGTQEQSGSVIFRRNNFEGRDRVLTAQLSASNTRRAAFQATTFSLSGSLERLTTIFFQKQWAWSVGGELAASDERDVIVSTGTPRRRTFFILALPTGVNYDGSDDLLNPTRGFRLGARFSPELSLNGSTFVYARTQVDGSAYKSLGARVVLAARARIGVIAGAPRDSIAPSRRFYAGGGASVRGYGFQAIGPRDPNNDPIGGRSLAEFSIEARLKLFGPFGLVPFLDAGNIYTSPLPRFSALQYGGGLGLRYYSSFGPIRIDVGTPINPRPGDARVAVYVSLGQAF
ncbi:MAG: autotransporter assembly complex protein TamA [Sphingomonas sp.]